MGRKRLRVDKANPLFSTLLMVKSALSNVEIVVELKKLQGELRSPIPIAGWVDVFQPLQRLVPTIGIPSTRDRKEGVAGRVNCRNRHGLLESTCDVGVGELPRALQSFIVDIRFAIEHLPD